MLDLRDNIIDMWQQLRANWKNALATHVLGTLIAYVLLTPLAGLLLNIAVARSGDAALSDQEILFFLLTPFGLTSLVVLGAIAITITAFKHAALMTVLQAARRGQYIHYSRALLFISRRSTHLVLLGMYMMARVLIYLIPLLAASWLVFRLTLSEHDINYYLSTRPTEFWIAVLIIGAMALVTAMLVLRMVIGWVYSLPLVLFENQSTRTALATSRATAGGKERNILAWLAVWFILDAVLLSLALGLMGAAGRLLVPLAIDNLHLLLAVLAAVLLLGGLLALVATFISAAYFSEIILFLYRSAGLQSDTGALSTPASDSDAPWISRRWILLGGVAALLVAAVFGKLLLDQLTVQDHAQIVAHRGASAAAPENTLAAIELALQQGTDWVEIDVQESADGEIVVIHDRDLKKIGGVDMNVHESTLAQLQSVDIGSWFAGNFDDQRIPTLSDVLQLCKGRADVNIELKYYGHEQQLEQRVADIVEATGMEDHIVVMSLSYKGISRMRELRPDWTLGLLSSVTAGDLGGLDLDFYAVNAGFVSRAFVRKAHEQGRQVMVWTLNDPVGMSKMLSRGIDAIITDQPTLAREVLAQRASLDSGQRLLIELATLFGHQPSLQPEEMRP